MVQDLKKGDRVSINGNMKGTFSGMHGNMCSIETDFYMTITTDCERVKKISE